VGETPEAASEVADRLRQAPLAVASPPVAATS